MLQADNVRYNIWVKMSEPFNYTEFCRLCNKEDVLPISPFDYAIKVGRFMVARHMYPEMTDIEAYLRLPNDYPLDNIHPHAHKPMPPVTIASMIGHQEGNVVVGPCCGGGKVL